MILVHKFVWKLSTVGNQQCVLLLRVWLTFIEHVKQAEKEHCQWKNESSKDYRI